MSSNWNEENDTFFSSLNKYIRNRSKHSFDTFHSVMANHTLTQFGARRKRRLSEYYPSNAAQKKCFANTSQMRSANRKQRTAISDEYLSNAALIHLYGDNLGS
jgi:hypothetical protein